MVSISTISTMTMYAHSKDNLTNITTTINTKKENIMKYIHWCKTTKKFVVRARVNGVTIFVSREATYECAVAAQKGFLRCLGDSYE